MQFLQAINQAFEGLPIIIEILMYLLCGSAVAVFICLFPKKTILRYAHLFYMEANFISIIRIPLSIAGIFIFMLSTGIWQFFGFLMIIAGMATDRLDGRVSFLNSEKRSEKAKLKGPWFDPLTDKVTIYGLFIVLSWYGYISVWLVLLAAIPDLINTLARSPFMYFQGHQKGPLQRFAKYFKANAATGLGKYKFAMQFIVVLICVPLRLEWFSESFSTLPDIALALAIIMGILSTLSRFNFNMPLIGSLEKKAKESTKHRR